MNVGIWRRVLPRDPARELMHPQALADAGFVRATLKGARQRPMANGEAPGSEGELMSLSMRPDCWV